MGCGTDEKFWYYGGSLKSLIFSGRFTISGELLKKGGFTVCMFKRGLSKKDGVVFLSGVDTLMYTMKWNEIYSLFGNCYTNVIMN